MCTCSSGLGRFIGWFLVQRPLLALVTLLDFIQGCKTLRSSESVVLDQKDVFPLGEKELGMELKSGNSEEQEQSTACLIPGPWVAEKKARVEAQTEKRGSHSTQALCSGTHVAVVSPLGGGWQCVVRPSHSGSLSARWVCWPRECHKCSYFQGPTCLSNLTFYYLDSLKLSLQFLFEIIRVALFTLHIILLY